MWFLATRKKESPIKNVLRFDGENRFNSNKKRQKKISNLHTYNILCDHVSYFCWDYFIEWTINENGWTVEVFCFHPLYEARAVVDRLPGNDFGEVVSFWTNTKHEVQANVAVKKKHRNVVGIKKYLMSKLCFLWIYNYLYAV